MSGAKHVFFLFFFGALAFALVDMRVQDPFRCDPTQLWCEQEILAVKEKLVGEKKELTAQNEQLQVGSSLSLPLP